jgi:hypothetical protein
MLIISVFSASTNISSSNKGGLSLFVSADECDNGDNSVEKFTKRNNEVKNMCQWAGRRRTDIRCKRIRTTLFDVTTVVMEECPCTCSEVIEKARVDNEAAERIIVTLKPTGQCPTRYSESIPYESKDYKPDILYPGTKCLPQYKYKLECEYEYTWIGCTEDEMKCRPTQKCTCSGLDFMYPGEWSCTGAGAEAVQACPRETRKPPRRRSLLRTILHDTGEVEDDEEEEEEQQRRNLLPEQGTPCFPMI